MQSKWGEPDSAQRALIVAAMVAQLRAHGVQVTENERSILLQDNGAKLAQIAALVASWEK